MCGDVLEKIKDLGLLPSCQILELLI